MAEISFITAVRNRKTELEAFIASLRSFYPTSEIVVCEQCDDRQFLQGQLHNLGYVHSHGELVVFMDVDLRFQKSIDLLECMNRIQNPFLAYNKILNCTKNGRVLGEREGSRRANGGCVVFTREQFERANGYSNLMGGWGGEDDVLRIRIGGKYERLKNFLLHVIHEKRKNPDTYDGNVVILEMEKDRVKELDGFRQTTAKQNYHREKNGVLYLGFSNIGVVPTFAYRCSLRDFR